jgi:hypothetical protein
VADGRAAIWSALIASTATLLCCALPSLLVLFGLGTTVAAVVSAAPWMVTLSHHKGWVFAVAGSVIVGSQLYVRYAVPRLSGAGGACTRGLSRLTRVAWWTSALLFAAGFLIAYGLGPLLEWRAR